MTCLFRRLILLALAGLVAASCGGEPPAANTLTGNRVITSNAIDGSITVVEVSSGRSVHIPVGSGPHELAASPNGETLIVPLFGRWIFGIGDGDGNKAAIVDAASGQLAKVVDLGNTRSPHGAIVLDDEKTAVIPALDSNELVFLDLESGSVSAKVNAGHPLYLISRQSGANLAYASSPKENVIIEFDPVAREITRKFDVSGAPGSMAVADDGSSLWVVRPEAKQITVLDLTSGAVVKSFDAVGFLRRLAISPDCSTVIVSEQSEVRVFDVASRTERGRIPVGEGVLASGVTFAADSRIAYVTLSNSAAVAELDVPGLKVLRRFETQERPDGVVFIDR